MSIQWWVRVSFIHLLLGELQILARRQFRTRLEEDGAICEVEASEKRRQKRLRACKISEPNVSIPFSHTVNFCRQKSGSESRSLTSSYSCHILICHILICHILSLHIQNWHRTSNIGCYACLMLYLGNCCLLSAVVQSQTGSTVVYHFGITDFDASLFFRISCCRTYSRSCTLGGTPSYTVL